MNAFLKLNKRPDSNGNVDLIANKTKHNYINLGGTNDKNVIDCVHAFMCNNNIWEITDQVIHTIKPVSYVPNPQHYHNISFVLRFYEISRLCKEEREKKVIHIDEPCVHEPLKDKNDIEKKSQQIIYKSLMNPNISHDLKNKKLVDDIVIIDDDQPKKSKSEKNNDIIMSDDQPKKSKKSKNGNIIIDDDQPKDVSDNESENNDASETSLNSDDITEDDSSSNDESKSVSDSPESFETISETQSSSSEPVIKEKNVPAKIKSVPKTNVKKPSAKKPPPKSQPKKPMKPNLQQKKSTKK